MEAVDAGRAEVVEKDGAKVRLGRVRWRMRTDPCLKVVEGAAAEGEEETRGSTLLRRKSGLIMTSGWRRSMQSSRRRAEPM